MPIAETIALISTVTSLPGTGITAASGAKELADVLRSRVKLPSVLTKLVAGAFREHLPRLDHLCLGEERPSFDENRFKTLLETRELSVNRPQDLVAALTPLLVECVNAPGAIHQESDFTPIYEAILHSALRGMWKEISRLGHIANEILLGQNQAILTQQTDLARAVDKVSTESAATAEAVKELTEFARRVWRRTYHQLIDSAPPSTHTFDQRTYLNPFLLARAEDFNHNYEKLARLFQGSPEWDAIQRRTENVFIEGGRGTGKSMLLRRLTAQATLASHRIDNSRIGFDEVPEDYFGVYVKFTRGYYEQLQPTDAVPPAVSSLLAQHELNIEVFDAFTSTLSWLLDERALPAVASNIATLVAELRSLFPKAPPVSSLEDLRQIIKYEQNQLLSYYRTIPFAVPHSYEGSARDTVGFIRELAGIFRRHISNRKEIRLFLLVDEFESLLSDQQVAFNTVMKMRLPDVAVKVAVRRDGRKTTSTFTKGDPIQKPRDYTLVPLDYDINSKAYRALLEGIAQRRLIHAGYDSTSIHNYLVSQPLSAEVPQDDLENAVAELWRSGNRQAGGADSTEFRTKYTMACVYRVHAAKNTRKSFAGFDSYVLLSSGVVSTFIELCKYTFYFALNDTLPVRDNPAIPTYLQTDAVYLVSERLFDAIEGNVEIVGSTLVQLISDLGAILRQRLLHHPSEPEANRISIIDYDQLDLPQYAGVKQVIDAAAVWSVVHIEQPRDAYRPRNSGRPPRVDMIVNRIYCPALGISPRARWRAEMSVRDLQQLVSPTGRAAAYGRLVRSLGAVGVSDDRQLGMFKSEGNTLDAVQPD
jgi:hypothetical protein